MRDPALTEPELAKWFTFPVDFYRKEDLTNPATLLSLLKPKQPPDPGRRVFGRPIFVAYDQQADRDVLYMRVDWKDATGQGAVRVKYVLIPSPTGQPYRMRAQTDGSL